MATIKGTAGNDDLSGTSRGDSFRLYQGGDDMAAGGQSKDRFLLRDTFTSADSIDGGQSFDTLVLNGDYGAGIVFGVATITDIEQINLKGGFHYTLTLNDANVGHNETLYINGGRLGAGDVLTFQGGAESNGFYSIRGGQGDDVLTGGGKDDQFFLRRGGSDVVFGGDGNDTFYMGGALDANDQINGNTNADSDVVVLNGNYSGANALTFTATTMTFIETLRLTSGHSYDLTLHEATLASGESMWIDGNLLGAGDVLTLDLSADTDGSYTVSGGAGDDVITGGSSSSSSLIHLEGGGNDTFTGGAVSDDVYFGAALTADDQIDGGGGFNSVILNGDYTGANALTFGATTMVNVTTLHLTGGHDYDLTTDDATVAFAGFLTVYGGSLTAGDTLVFDGSAETNAMFTFGDGSGDDILRGGEAADVFNLSGGSDTVIVGSAGASSSLEYDTLTGWNFDADKLDLFMTVAAIASPASGTINSGSFNTDMGAAINDNLAANNAILVTATGGDLNGTVFLVIEGGGTGSGYDSGTDVVLNITGFSGTLDTSDFI